MKSLPLLSSPSKEEGWPVGMLFQRKGDRAQPRVGQISLNK